MKKRKKLLAIGFALLLLFSGQTTAAWADMEDAASAEDAAAAVSMTEAQALGGMTLAAENEYLELWFDETETDFAVLDKSSGKVWFSNPVDTALDTVSTAYYQKVLKSQLVLTYINESTQVSTMNNYAASIEDGQFEVEWLENGVKVTYLMGESSAFLLLPEAISQERMEQFTANMSESQVKKINRNYTLYSAEDLSEAELKEFEAEYPTIRQTNLYVLRGGVKDYLKEELAEYFEEAGYTESDYELDEENVGVQEADDSVWFEIPVVYQLEGENLTATIDPEAVSYNDNGYYLVSIDLLRYFGASLNDDGYLFVPDGCGALINFNNGKTDVSSYGAQVYGQDETMVYTSYYQSQIDASDTIKMPVFGVKDGEKALFAIIEGGDAYATINAEVSGKTTGYNDVYVSFSYLQYGETSLDDMVGANSYYMYSQPEFEGNYSIRYAFLSGEDADYSGMASYYRSYLIDAGVLGERLTGTELPFYVEYIGAVDKSKTFLGVKYTATEALTTYAGAEAITELLLDGGVENLSVIYSGWMNGGLHGTAATKLKPVSQLNSGGVTLSDFLSYAEDKGIGLYMTVDLQYVYQNKLLDGYSSLRYSPRYFDNTTIKINDFGLASGVSEGELADLISPYYVCEVTEKLSGSLQKKNISGINLGTLSWELYSDLQKGNYTDRQMAEGYNTSAIQTLADAGMSVLGDNANAYVWSYADELVNVPLSSNHYMIIDEEVPFYEMVLHGYVQYAGEALNLADDFQTSVLKSIESGAGLNFKWIYEDNSTLKDTDYDALYSVNYESWLDTALETYRQVNEALGFLQGEEIVSHEIVETDVVRVTYGDGSVVYVNYTDQDKTVDGVLVGAMDFAVRRGGA